LDDLKQQLQTGLVQMGISIAPSVQAQLLEYLQHLHKWNKIHNLTAVRDPGKMVARHLLDSLSLLPYIKGNRVLDVGTGAGLPGLPLALAMPDKKFTLLDSNLKKTQFLVQTCAALGTENTEIIQNRIEKFQPDEKFDTLVSRAFASLGDLVQATAHLSHGKICWLAMKGRYPKEEIEALPGNVQVESVINLSVPDTEGERRVIVLHPS